MYLEHAQTIQDWHAASRLLLDVMKDLNHNGCTLWIESQLTFDALKKQYREDELYLVKSRGILKGVVFLQEQDPYFWPEISNRDSLFLHKLAIRPQYRGSGKGNELIKLAEQEAIQRGLTWLRLDCDDREPLHRFYLDNGFELVDIKAIDAFKVARYEKLLTHTKTT